MPPLALRRLPRCINQRNTYSFVRYRNGPIRTFASGPTTPPPQPEFQRAKDKAAVGVFDWRAAGLFVATGIGLYFYFEHHKAQVQEQKRKEIKKLKYGKAFVGGPFDLVDSKTKTRFTQDNLIGQWNLIYFGFTNCPDVCPEELDKMTVVVDQVEKKYGEKVQPIFISCDPARDTEDQMEKYLADFHPRMVGLTGTYDQVKAACKSYRVYFSTPPNTKPGDDYLVDHSIFFYLMDPAGNFVEAFGKTSTADDVCNKFDEALLEWKERPLDQRT
ncbi:putative SCO1-involved in stabilization of Cox1p and Cox2p [Serendipita vermifera]|nr:putative SCO1-involved in stabilization of Cox1p and Cox2p [Serendipita vermifera]